VSCNDHRLLLLMSGRAAQVGLISSAGAKCDDTAHGFSCAPQDVVFTALLHGGLKGLEVTKESSDSSRESYVLVG
jgi:hypothetical protein